MSVSINTFPLTRLLDQRPELFLRIYTPDNRPNPTHCASDCGFIPDEECVGEFPRWSIDDSIEACWPHGTQWCELDLVLDWPSVPLLGSSTCEPIGGSEPNTVMTGTSTPTMPGPDQCSKPIAPASSLMTLGMETSTSDGLLTGSWRAARAKASHCVTNVLRPESERACGSRGREPSPAVSY